MLSNFVNEAVSTFHDIEQKYEPTLHDVADELDNHIEHVKNILEADDDMGPARFAAGYLGELMGEDYLDYILGCYTVNADLTAQLDNAMAYYTANDRENGDEVLYVERSNWSTAMANCSKANGSFAAIW